ncbi:alanyl-tRNA editing protein [Amorphus orientalis]|uniref:Alanine--tRNA ligase n=1 Tax=Amorphus orientalis TaxID=649198 RepID=A0AAE4AV41_9HYPH|nr:alanyl-tRNA editing protein [Amorphus orientalis]MDQ0316334.1 misacylated tRNA(Ala) deacylase [Amorphus orientalis]
MVETTVPLFRDDAYLRSCEATVVAHAPDGGIVLDRTVFYAAGGGQPGDTGHLEDEHRTRFAIVTSRYGEDRTSIIHQVDGEALPAVGTQVRAELDWDRRQRHMRMHSALHLLTAVLTYPVTGGQIGADESRLDFDIPDGGLDKDAIAAAVNEMIMADHAIAAEWITDAELDANPALVKTMSVQPPRGSGRIRLVRIGDKVDLQPCGGTHVRRTAEIGPIAVTKIEKKGRQNRRVRIQLSES